MFTWLFEYVYPMMIDLFSQDGNTALHYTTSGGYVNCMKLLLEGGADINLKNKVNIVQNKKNVMLTVTVLHLLFCMNMCI